MTSTVLSTQPLHPPSNSPPPPKPYCFLQKNVRLCPLDSTNYILLFFFFFFPIEDWNAKCKCRDETSSRNIASSQGLSLYTVLFVAKSNLNLTSIFQDLNEIALDSPTEVLFLSRDECHGRKQTSPDKRSYCNTYIWNRSLFYLIFTDEVK